MADLPISEMQKLLGKPGIDLWQKANGVDNSAVIPYHEQKSMSSENTFEADTLDTVFLLQEIARLVEKLCFDLRQDHKVTGCVAIKLRYENFETVSRQTVMEYTAADHMVLPVAKQLFTELYRLGRPVRLIGVRLSHLVGANQQVSLFESVNAAPQLYQAIDDVKQKFGAASLQRAVSVRALNHPSLRPGEPLWINRNAGKEEDGGST